MDCVCDNITRDRDVVPNKINVIKDMICDGVFDDVTIITTQQRDPDTAVVCDRVFNYGDIVAMKNKYSMIGCVCDDVPCEGVAISRYLYSLFVVCNGVVEEVVKTAPIIQQDAVMVVNDGIIGYRVVIRGIIKVDAITVT